MTCQGNGFRPGQIAQKKSLKLSLENVFIPLPIAGDIIHSHDTVRRRAGAARQRAAQRREWRGNDDIRRHPSASFVDNSGTVGRQDVPKQA